MVGLIGLALLPSIYRGKMSFLLFLTCLAAFLSLAGYWYVKNLIVLGNPIYPFIFGHPGLSDQWMANYRLELGRAFDPAYRVFVTDLTTRQGATFSSSCMDGFWIAGNMQPSLSS